MSRRERRRAPVRARTALWAGPALAMLSLLVATVPAAAQSSTCSSSAGKCVLVDVASVGTSAGEYSVTVTNEAGTQSLGSMDLTVPAGFSAISVSGLSFGSASISGNVVELRDLGLAPGGTMTFTVDATPPEACTAVTYTWGALAKQSNNFNGPPGNEFALDTDSQLSTTVPAVTCHLAFYEQPQDSQVGSAISGVAGDPSGPAVSVAVEDTSLNVVPVSGVTISLSVTQGVPLSGVTSSSTSAGLAAFAYPVIDTSGSSYTLTATAEVGGISGPATSNSFSVFDVLQACTQGSVCSGSDTNSGTTGKDYATSISVSTSGGGLMGMSLLSPDVLSCSGYTAVSATALTEELGGTGTTTVTLYIGKGLVDASPNNGASFYQICFEYPASSGSTFTDSSGDLVPAGTPGLLPDCSSTTSAPCVVSRNKTKAGVVEITFTTPSGDPFTRG